MKFVSRMTYHPEPIEPNEIIVSHEIDVLCHTSDHTPVVAGRVAVDYLDFGRAEKLGQPVVHVCDADSASWIYLYSNVIEPSHDFDEIRKDFGFDDAVDGLLYLHQSVSRLPNLIRDARNDGERSERTTLFFGRHA